MDLLINYLLKFGKFRPEDILLIKSKVEMRYLKRDDHYAQAGKIPREIAFLTEGILRVCYTGRSGEEITRFFIEENNFAVDIDSYNQNLPSDSYAHLITDCTFAVLS